MPKTGDYESSGEANTQSPERHYRITLDFRLLVRPVTPAACRESFFDGGAGGQHPREEVERQQRLYALLLNNKQVLERYLLTVVAQEAAGFVFGGLAEAFGMAEDEDLLAPLYAQMSEEDAGYFEERAEAGMLWESTGLVAQAFAVEWVGAECTEMRRRVIGDLTKAGGGRAGGYTPVKET